MNMNCPHFLTLQHWHMLCNDMQKHINPFYNYKKKVNIICIMLVYNSCNNDIKAIAKPVRLAYKTSKCMSEMTGEID